MAQYIPPHARGAGSPDKSQTLNVLTDIFEPRNTPDSKNITVRKSSVSTKLAQTEIDKKESIAEDTETKSKDDPGTDLNNPELLTILKSIDSRLASQGATLDKLNVSQSVMQKSIEFGHANSSDLKDRIVTLEKENQKLLSQNVSLTSQGRDMSRRLDSIEQQLAQIDHNNRRRNILIDGVVETAGENIIDIAIDILSSVDQSLTKGDIDFTQRVFRPGNKTKPILVVLKSVAQRDGIMNKKKSLKGCPNMSKIWINEDPNSMIRKQKLESRTVVKHAITKGYDAQQKGLGVEVNGKFLKCVMILIFASQRQLKM